MLAILSSLALSAQDSVFPKLNQLPIWLVWHPVLVFFLPQSSNFMYLTVSQMGFFFLRIFYDLSWFLFTKLSVPSCPCYSVTLSQLDVLFSPWIPQWLIWEITAALLQTNINLYRLNFSVTQPSPQVSTLLLWLLVHRTPPMDRAIDEVAQYLQFLSIYLVVCSLLRQYILPVCQRQSALKELPQAFHGVFWNRLYGLPFIFESSGRYFPVPFALINFHFCPVKGWF